MGGVVGPFTKLSNGGYNLYLNGLLVCMDHLANTVFDVRSGMGLTPPSFLNPSMKGKVSLVALKLGSALKSAI